MANKKRAAIVFWAIAAVLTWAGCVPMMTSRLGVRPAEEPLDAAEEYLRRYQPGPEPRVFQTTHVYDRHGTPIAVLWNEGRRTWVRLDRVSRHLIDATIAVEDASFYSNSGVDPARVFGAAFRNAQEGQVVSGASTITMQLARNLFLGPDQRYEQTMDRKMLEGGLAQELTALFSKDELLEMYLNLLNYGHLAYGPEAAAQIYFGKPAAELTLAEATLLAGIPQQPANLDLFRNLEGAKQRQRVVLDMMVRHGYMIQADSDAVFAETIVLNPDPDLTLANSIVPHFVHYAADVVGERLGGADASRAGLTITTTLDLKMQGLAQDLVARKVKELRPKHNLSNAALVAMRPGSGEILAMVGSANFADKSISGEVNVARSLRQPGSAIKPVLYATALSDGLISPATVLWDVPAAYTTSRGQVYRPANYDGKFHGPVTVRTALANSYNIPAVKLLDAMGLARMLESAQAMGVFSLNRGQDWYGLSLALGGGEVTLLDLTRAYSGLASAGQAVVAEPILAATDTLGRPASTVLPRSPDGRSQVISAAAAFQVTDILSDNAARTPMFGANSALKLSRPAAAKTGTTDSWRDNWTMGYTRYLVAGVWAGNSDGKPMTKVSGVAGAGPIWHDFMEAVLKDPALLAELGVPAGADAAAWEFAPPADVVQRADCPPRLKCRTGGEYFSQAWLAATGDADPLADSVVRASSAAVFGAGQLTAFCRAENNTVRALLRLPDGLDSADLAAGPASQTSAERVRAEQLQVIAWSLRHPLPVELGPCDALVDTVPQALAADLLKRGTALQVLIDLQAGEAADSLAPAAEVAAKDMPPAEEEAVAGDETAQLVSTGPGDYRFLPASVEHNAACPGDYVLGRVITPDGAPLAGVHVVLADQWGNRADAWSKSGDIDLGNYDFLVNNFANRYTLTVVDEAGNPISPNVMIDHRQGDAGDAPCHNLVWIGG